MFTSPLQTAIVAIAALYFFYRMVSIHERRQFVRELLTAEFQPMSSDPELSNPLCLNEEQAAAWKRWTSMQSASLWSMYTNAGVMIEIADFVDQNCTGVDQELLTALRNDAMQIRSCALIELTKYARSRVSERTIGNAARAAAYYADILSRTARLLEENRAELALSLANSM
jgi:hypothetical protein